MQDLNKEWEFCGVCRVYVAAPPTASSDTVCKRFSPLCAANEVEVAPATATSDRLCRNQGEGFLAFSFGILPQT
jgi:hypothetical protein